VGEQKHKKVERAEVRNNEIMGAHTDRVLTILYMGCVSWTGTWNWVVQSQD